MLQRRATRPPAPGVWLSVADAAARLQLSTQIVRLAGATGNLARRRRWGETQVFVPDQMVKEMQQVVKNQAAQTHQAIVDLAEADGRSQGE